MAFKKIVPTSSIASSIYVPDHGFVEGFHSIPPYHGKTKYAAPHFVSLDRISIAIESNFALSKYSHRFLESIVSRPPPFTAIARSCTIIEHIESN